ncbi:MAG: thioredoxin family protein [Gemmataceae bacterium]
MLPFAFFDKALSYADFFAAHGTPADQARWDRTRAAVRLTDEQTALLQSFTRTTNVLLLAGAWCGDCAGNCPIFEAFAAAAPVLKVRYLDRDAHPDAQKELQINGGNRVPVAVFFSEDGLEVARYGERTLTAYRKMVGQVSGEACGTGIAGGDFLAGIVADWLREVERVQYVLRLSPRLRRLHGD